MKLFEPGKIGTMEVKNRIVMAPMNVGRMAGPDGTWGDIVREYYVARARGGTGLITTMWAAVTRKWEPFLVRFLNLYSDRQLDLLKKMVAEIHQYGAKISIQLTAGFGRVVTVKWQDPYIAPVSSSATPCYFNPDRITRALTTEEVEELAQAFGAAAKRCQMAGADAIELHGHEGYLLDQFQTALWNYRTDKYGGSREKRLTLVREAMAFIRKAVGNDFPVIYRIGLNHYLKGGLVPEESLWILKQLEEMGFDGFHVDAGCYETMWWPHPPTYQPPGCMVDMAEMAKRTVKAPIISVGKLNYPDLAEKVLQEGKADFIAIGRGLIADPDWANKVKEGRLEDITPCIGDQEGCIGELHSNRATSCTVNPACSHENEWVLKPLKKKKTLLIVGGGPAGMEAARVAALRGLDVTLWEKTEKLGGNLWAAAVPEFKKDLRDLINYQVTQVKKQPVHVELNREATAGDILKFGADHTILATGAVPMTCDIPGADTRNMVTARELLLNKSPIVEKVIVVGGGLVGGETAVYLAQKGHKVTIVECLPNILSEVINHNRLMLLEMLADNKVKVLTSSQIVRVLDDGVLVNKKGQEEILPAKSLVVAIGMCPCSELQQALAGKVNGLHTIGDCVEPRHILNAIWEAFSTARTIE